MTKLAVFDLDGTILKGWSAEARLFWYLIKSGVVGPYQCLSYALEGIRRLPRGFVKSFQHNKYYLKGVRAEELTKLVPEFCEVRLRRNFSSKVVNRIGELKKRGYRVVILSGSLYPLLKHLQVMLGVDDIIGACLEEEGSVYTGRLSGARPYGKEKVNKFNEYFKGEEIDYVGSTAFADHKSDLCVLEKFGSPVVVRPRRRLRKIASERDWEIIG
jgi:HAD superfamily hydrolase (TIGR01490 family)